MEAGLAADFDVLVERDFVVTAAGILPAFQQRVLFHGLGNGRRRGGNQESGRE